MNFSGVILGALDRRTKVLVSVARDRTVGPGQVHLVPVGVNQATFIVSPQDVTVHGAASLQKTCRHFLRSGHWVRGTVGDPIRAEYVVEELGEDVAVIIDCRGGHIFGKLSGDHFSAGFADALTETSARYVTGWSYVGRLCCPSPGVSGCRPRPS